MGSKAERKNPRAWVNEKDIKSIQEKENKYRKIGVTGIPTFILNNEYVIPGTQTKEFWLPILQDKTFTDWIQKRYTIGSVEMVGEEVSDDDIQEEYDKVW